MSDGFFNKFLNFIGLEEVSNNDDEFDEKFSGEAQSEEETEAKQPFFQTRYKKGKVVNIHTSSYIKVVVYQPLTYDDTQVIIDNLKNRKPVIVNLESLDWSLAQRVLDFISGAIYAVDGTIQKVSNVIFILAPNNVDITGNIPEELKGKSFFTLADNKSTDE